MIFYFTATGNSLYAAQKVQKALGGPLQSIAEAIKGGKVQYTLEENEKVGFVLPVYFYGIPTIVEDFISKLEITGERKLPVFLILTCGQKTGGAAEYAEKLLAHRNLIPDFKFAVAMPDNYVIMLAPPGNEEKKEMLDHADRELDAIIVILKENRPGNYNKIKGKLNNVETFLLSPIYKNGRHTKKFYATDSCIHCGLCEKICPIQAIEMRNGKPEWTKKQCVHCLACLHRCPATAIQYGKGTLKRGRYVNPNVRLES